jgi:uncharacterized membrane protein
LSQQDTLVAQEKKASFRFSRKQTIALVAFCTILGAAAQVLIKIGASSLTGTGPIAMLSNFHVLAGYSLYGLFTAVLVLALRDGELSILYPVISLTFVWVTILSTILFHESLTASKLMGISIIVSGVGVLGMGGRR